jgi:hypothetical protein
MSGDELMLLGVMSLMASVSAAVFGSGLAALLQLARQGEKPLPALIALTNLGGRMLGAFFIGAIAVFIAVVSLGPLRAVAVLALGLIVGIGALMFGGRIQAALGRPRVGKTIFGALALLGGLYVLGVSLRGGDWRGILAGVVFGAAGGWLVYEAVRDLIKGEPP